MFSLLHLSYTSPVCLGRQSFQFPREHTQPSLLREGSGARGRSPLHRGPSWQDLGLSFPSQEHRGGLDPSRDRIKVLRKSLPSRPRCSEGNPLTATVVTSGHLLRVTQWFPFPRGPRSAIWRERSRWALGWRPSPAPPPARLLAPRDLE